jgi:TPR repeat protein
MRGLLFGLACVGIALGASAGLARGAEGGLPDLDDPKFQYETGMSYLTGQGAPRKDPAEGVTWLRKAALRGYADAQVQLGICFQQGFGVERDLAQALAWFRRAAEQGNARGQLQVGLAYQRGQGVAPDQAQALDWIRKAAENGHSKAQLELGIAYRDGRGVARDPAEAAFWMALAADGGSPMARMVFTGVRNELSEAQRAELKARVESWKREHPGAPSASDS